jgi:hypothetical protein
MPITKNKKKILYPKKEDVIILSNHNLLFQNLNKNN